MIDSKAVIDPNADLAADVSVGPFSVIESDVEIGAGTDIGSHVVIRSGTRIGAENKIYSFASIGEDPQFFGYAGEPTRLEIGDHNIIREYVTLNRGSSSSRGTGTTTIGNHNFIMAYSHVAHDCVIKDNCILSNAASLAGHVRVGDHVSLGGFTLVHQFCDIGDYAFSGLGSVISRDITPYTLVAGNHAQAYKINTAGLKRKGFSQDVISSLEKTFKLFIKSKSNRDEVLESFKKLNINCPEVDYFLNFINSSERGVTR